jgi:N-acetylgalactosamine-N,N'-diacetylbacillosaminyl-diphospho-undecaprenol 4-alpha-N-acetylgalactosaminyltransferase
MILLSAVLINDLRSGGAERVVSNLINQSDNSIMLIQIWPKQFYSIYSDKSFFLLDKKGILIVDIIKATYLLIRLVKKKEIGVINSHLFWANYINIISSIVSGQKTVLTHCVSFVSKFKNARLSRLIHFFLGTVLFRFGDKHIFKSLDMKSEYESIFKLQNGVVIYNPINISVVLRLSTAQPEFKFDLSKKYLLCVGRFHKTKNQSILIDALNELPSQYEIIFLGEGEMLYSCKEKALKLNLSKRTHFLGNCNNPFPFYRNADLYISVSQSEGFPNALIEAIALKCFPIVFDCPTGPREILSSTYQSHPVQTSRGFDIYGLGILLKDYSSHTIASAILSDYLVSNSFIDFQRSNFLSSVESQYIFELYMFNLKKNLEV